MSCYDWVNDKNNNFEPIYDLKLLLRMMELIGNVLVTAIKLMPGWGGISKASILKIGDFSYVVFL